MNKNNNCSRHELNIIKNEYEKLYNKLSAEALESCARRVKEDINRINKEMGKELDNSSDNQKKIYELNKTEVYLPVKLQNKARKNAEKLGMYKNNKGNLSGYIGLLINNDLKNSNILNYKIINNKVDTSTNYGKSKRTRIFLTEEQQKEGRKRAYELGLIRNGEGNLSAYVRLLIIFND